MYRKKQPLSYQEVLSKMMKYCSYQERSLFEVKQKLKSLETKEADIQNLIEYLEKENFINEQRFAETYVRGKVNVKKWGVFKIREGLSAKGVDSKIITLVLKKINQSTYITNLRELAEKKLESLRNEENRKEKLYRFLHSKGYESSLIIEELKCLELM